MSSIVCPFNFEHFRPYIVVDTETDGPAPGKDLYSMTAFSAVVVEPDFKHVFTSYLSPISEQFDSEALAVSGMTREMTLTEQRFRDPHIVMNLFVSWLSQFKNPIFVSENLGFDWAFMLYYMTVYIGPYKNPFGHSGMDVYDVYAGIKEDANLKPVHISRLRNTHNPEVDARQKAEILCHLMETGTFLPKVQKVNIQNSCSTPE